MEHIGPTYSVNITQPGVAGVNFVQEELAIVGTESDGESYALLGYTPTEDQCIQIFKDGLFLLQGTDYDVDGRKIAFNDPFGDSPSTETARASYNTTAIVASIPAVEIEFDIPGLDVRVSSAGSLQVLVSNGDDPETFSWHDMLPSVHPITGGITYDVVQAVSAVQ